MCFVFEYFQSEKKNNFLTDQSFKIECIPYQFKFKFSKLKLQSFFQKHDGKSLHKLALKKTCLHIFEHFYFVNFPEIKFLYLFKYQ